jgi:hypothetical protein
MTVVCGSEVIQTIQNDLLHVLEVDDQIQISLADQFDVINQEN